MIDTIVILLTKDLFDITQPNKFKPSAIWANEPSYKTRGIQSKHFPKRGNTYLPSLTLAHKANSLGSQVFLKIELSLPKLMFGNNLDELQYKDFKTIIPKLVDALKDMGVMVSPQTLTNAHISAIHYAKNIPLTDGSIPYQYINKIKEANVQLSLDVNQTDYRNEGHSYKWHCNTYEVAFYDKIKELDKSQPMLRHRLRRAGKKLEILRMEVRLNNRKRIKHLLKKLNIKSDLTFKSLFKPAIAKKVLLHYIDELESKRPSIIDYKPSLLGANKDKALLCDLIFNNPELKPYKIIQAYGFKKILEVVNLRELRVLFGKYSKNSWYKLIADLNKVNLPSSNRPFDVIRECITKFKPFSLKTLK